ncbi:MAG: outer membrane beta-barrel protein, partial [Bacteroidetes bacterium]|nr:outer membrane beta-barrel protein [Bacteroidota bacterium]
MTTIKQFQQSISARLLMALLLLASFQQTSFSQDTLYTKPSWWFGVAGGANLNMFNGSTQNLNDNLMAPVPFHTGNSIGLYIAPHIEYNPTKSLLGFMFQVGFDSRKGVFKEVYSPCNCPRDLSTNLSYLTIEPSLKFKPMRGNFYLYGGPRVAYNLQKSFTFKEKANPDIPDQDVPADVKADFSHINPILISMQIGAGYDIRLSPKVNKTQWVLSPYISYHPYFGQNPRDIETWTLNTIRVGAILKLGTGHKVDPIIAQSAPPIIIYKEKEVIVDTKIKFSVHAPANIPVVRKVREIFPLRNYIFFDLGSTEIPSRYVQLNKDQAKEFGEDRLEVYKPTNTSGRSEKQMLVYYNLLNILGNRMVKNPDTRIKLVGSSELGKEDGLLMSESIKKYLVNTFGIDPNRIATDGNGRPEIPSERPGGTKELILLREGDRRVSIESSSPLLLMEFQIGPSAPLKPIEIIALQQAPVESYVTFTVNSDKEPIKFWTMEIKDDSGVVQYYGPYTQEEVVIPGLNIMKNKKKGEFLVTMIAETKDGKIVRHQEYVNMVLWTPATDEEVTRFSVIFEFNEATVVTIYEKYINEVIVPKIKDGETIIIHGYSDVIGDAAYNKKLSVRRSNDVR